MNHCWELSVLRREELARSLIISGVLYAPRRRCRTSRRARLLSCLPLARSLPFFPLPLTPFPSPFPLACNKTFIRVTREPLSRVKCICLAFRGEGFIAGCTRQELKWARERYIGKGRGGRRGSSLLTLIIRQETRREAVDRVNALSIVVR